MQTQMTLDGKPMFSSITNEDIAYHGKLSILKTLHCIGELGKHFGIASEDMINALMMYPIED